MCCELCHLIAKCKHSNFVQNHDSNNSQHYTDWPCAKLPLLTQGGEDHHEDALRAVHLEVLDGNAITPGLVRVWPRAAVTSLPGDLFPQFILVY